MALERLEPCDGNLSCTVLMGLGGGNTLWLPGKYKGKLLTKPSKRSIKTCLGNIRTFIKSHATVKTEDLIRQLNPKIRGWANYHRHGVAKAAFNYVDCHMFEALMRWIRRRHPEKSAGWRYKTYFRTYGARHWVFSTMVKTKTGNRPLDLFKAASLPIRRHVKIRAEANPYDPQYASHFRERERTKKRLHAMDKEFLNPTLKHLLGTLGQPGHLTRGFRKA
jgi:RNA-directed DNA polymerase